MRVRWMIRRDMPSVLRIENASFEYPWTEEDFLSCLRMRSCVGIVAEDIDGNIAGFAIYDLEKSEVRVLSLAVAAERRRDGVGRAIVEKVIYKSVASGRNGVVAEVRETNLQAQLFFRKMGFRAVAIVKEFYEDTNEDAYRMEYLHESVAR